MSQLKMMTETYVENEPVLDNGKYIWDIEQDESGNDVYIPAYEMRYVDSAGDEITKAEYDAMKADEQAVYKCAFIGCVYMCG